MPVSVVKSTQERVYPAAPSPGVVMQLSTCDQAMHRVYIPLVFFFAEKPPLGASLVVKAALAEALTIFYPAAGRFRQHSNNGELEIVCNDEGAVLHETWVNCAYDHFMPDFGFHPDFLLLTPPSSNLLPSVDVCEAPPLAAQITHFECGRLCLCISCYHPLCDANSASDLFRCWATLAGSKLAKCTGQDLQEEDCPRHRHEQPYLDRSLLKACPLPAFPGAAAAATTINHDHPEYEPHTMPGMPDVRNTGVTSSKIFAFSPSDIDAIRAKETTPAAASAGATSSAPFMAYTRFEALAGHILRGITVARALPREQIIRIRVSVDGRRRLKPNVPSGYFGNAVFFGYAETTAGEIVEKPAAYAGGFVKEAIARVTDKHMRSALAWIAGQAALSKPVRPMNPLPSTDVALLSWMRLPLYDLDFGWGKPSFVRIAAPSIGEGWVVMLPSPIGQGHACRGRCRSCTRPYVQL